jgi:hypothetical protein
MLFLISLILVCAVQSYNLAQILLALYSPGIPPGIAALSFLRRMEVQVESYAREICGISLTNANVSARINAVEPLRLCTPSRYDTNRLRWQMSSGERPKRVGGQSPSLHPIRALVAMRLSHRKLERFWISLRLVRVAKFL